MTIGPDFSALLGIGGNGAAPSLPPLPGLPSSSAKDPGPRSDVPVFPDPEPLKFTDEEKARIIDTIDLLHRETIESREAWNKKHQDYDLMFRGSLDLRGDNPGPWPNSSNLHVQMPYWLADAYTTRLNSGIWGQTPLVMSHPTEDDDAEVGSNAANLVKWDLSPRRMNAQAAWSRISKTRCIHGKGVGYVPWAKDEYVYKVAGPSKYAKDEEGRLIAGEDGLPSETEDSRQAVYRRETKYDGPLLVPVAWDDVLEPLEGINLQPVTPSNPLGADWVAIRQWESLSLIWKKKDGSYPYIDSDEELSDREKWLDAAPSQDRSGDGAGSATNQNRTRMQDFIEGHQRRDTLAGRSPRTRSNPEFEILYWFMPWEIENENGEKEEAEIIFFYRVEPKALLGAFRLTDIQWRNRRPLIQLEFQTFSTRRDPMGIMEIVADMSAELDTIHNMRMDVGFFTNIPFFFFRATSHVRPEKIVLRPGKGIPVDDIRDVQFPQMQNVTSFYHQEEQLLYLLVERVLGITDLFLGVSPTKGAAARHATGFVGTQQEAMARTEEVMSRDAATFSELCHLVYEAEVQFGPDERIVRLEGKQGPLSQKLTREDLWFRGEYDFTLGANHGLYSSMMRQQQAQILQQQSQISPFLNQDPGRRWEAEKFIFNAYGFPDPEIFIGPKSAISAGSPTDPTEEDGKMSQFVYGVGVPAPVHPSDNDAEHLRDHLEYLNSPTYTGLGRPNLAAFMAHIQQTQAQMMRKQQMQEMATMQGMGGQQTQPSQPGMSGMMGQTGQPNARNVASLGGVEQSGAMGDVSASPAAQGMM